MKKNLSVAVYIMFLAFAIAGLNSKTCLAGGAAGGGALESTQWLNKGLLADILGDTGQQVLKDVEKLREMVEQTRHMVQNAKKLASLEWTGIGNLVAEIKETVGKVNSLYKSIENLSDEMNHLFPDLRTQYGSWENFRNYVWSLDDSFKQNLEGVLAEFKVSWDDFNDTAAALGKIKEKVDASEGHQQTLQALADIDLILTQEVGKVNQTLARQSVFMAQTEMYKMRKEQMDEELRANQRKRIFRQYVPPKRETNAYHY